MVLLGVESLNSVDVHCWREGVDKFVKKGREGKRRKVEMEIVGERKENAVLKPDGGIFLLPPLSEKKYYLLYDSTAFACFGG